MTHHKSNRDVEGDPEHAHNRGMPLRVNDDELYARTERERREAGLVAGPTEDPESAYRREREEIDLEVGAGRIPTGNVTRRSRDPFPPSRYEY
ncbi:MULTISPECIES: hypothetical protein [unclassified Streptomyces]|uniref:hypothetical protein n=1 Tax=unclassified Streptomyces TaxID=2593676 RepID=UPI00225A8753|nr:MULTISPECIES: hypothetical protein [unclassified Streptomyces]MCX4987670.1 hypothetical protein [Streptomyces sp. NBC_00568]MCX5007198.1 hypothetical protein [Streptomyces sp. NBC_00638]